MTAADLTALQAELVESPLDVDLRRILADALIDANESEEAAEMRRSADVIEGVVVRLGYVPNEVTLRAGTWHEGALFAGHAAYMVTPQWGLERSREGSSFVAPDGTTWFVESDGPGLDWVRGWILIGYRTAGDPNDFEIIGEPFPACEAQSRLDDFSADRLLGDYLEFAEVWLGPDGPDIPADAGSWHTLEPVD